MRRWTFWHWAFGFASLLFVSRFVLGEKKEKPLFEQGKRPLRGVIPAPLFPASKPAERSGVWGSKAASKPVERSGVRGSRKGPEPRPAHPLSASACVECHKTTVGEWKTSRHAQAFTNRLYQVALQHSPYRWCVHCHAPLPEQFEEVRSWIRDLPPPSKEQGPKEAKVPEAPKIPEAPTAASLGTLHREGVNCAVCHVREGQILSASPPTPKGLQRHPMRHEPLLKESRFCAGCHQFNFTKALTTPTEITQTPAQDTYHEWRTSHAKAQGKTCQSCHMPKGKHFFPGAHDIAFVKKAIRVEVSLLDPQTAEIRLTSQKVGHAIPTGDPFRRLKLVISDPSASSGKAKLASFTFQKVFRSAKQGWTAFRDDRLPPPTTTKEGQKNLRLRLSRPVDAILWRLSYLYAEFQHHAFLKASERSALLLEGRVGLHHDKK